MYDPASLKDRLARLAARCEQDGAYTDQIICERALARIEELERLLDEAKNVTRAP